MTTIQDMAFAAAQGGRIERVVAQNVSLPLASVDVWTTGGQRVLPAAAAVVSLVSGSANDDVGGTGAQEVTIYGLDEDMVEQAEVVQLDGVAPVLSVGKFLRVFYVQVTKVGTPNGSNAGAITASQGGNPQATIPVGRGRSEASHYMVPARMNGELIGLDYNWADAEKATVQVVALLGGVLVVLHEFTTGLAASGSIDLLGLPSIPPGTDVFVRAAKLGGAQNTGLSVSYAIFLNPKL